jgi:hypothetical protein
MASSIQAMEKVLLGRNDRMPDKSIADWVKDVNKILEDFDQRITDLENRVAELENR